MRMKQNYLPFINIRKTKVFDWLSLKDMLL
jgi:hypothetical protein